MRTTRYQSSLSLVSWVSKAVGTACVTLTLAACAQPSTSQSPAASTQPAAAAQTAPDAPRLVTEGTNVTEHGAVFDIGEATLGYINNDKDRTIGERSIFITDGTIKITVRDRKVLDVFTQKGDNELVFQSTDPKESYDMVRVGNATYQNCRTPAPPGFPARDCTAHIFSDVNATTPVLWISKSANGAQVTIHSNVPFSDPGWQKADVWTYAAAPIARTRLVLGPPTAPPGTWAQNHIGGPNSTGVPDLGWRGVAIRRRPE
jgi:hypothetical protein